MLNKVYLAFVKYDNGEAWEDHFERNVLLGVADTFERAIEFFNGHMEERMKDYKLIASDKRFLWNPSYIGDKDEFHLYACYESMHKERDFDESTYAYYILEEEVVR